MKNIINRDVIETSKSVVVLVGTDWCYPCKLMTNQLNNLIQGFNEIEFFSIDLEQNYYLSRKYNIIAVPTILFFNNGRLEGKLNNYKTKNVTYNWLKQNIEKRDICDSRC